MSQHITSLDTYRLLGRSGLRASPLTLGTMTFASSSREAATRSSRLHRNRGESQDPALLYSGPVRSCF